MRSSAGARPPLPTHVQQPLVNHCIVRLVGDRYNSTVKGQFFGHIHVDQWTLNRVCKPAPLDPTKPPVYTMTTGIKWCASTAHRPPIAPYG